MATIHDFRVLQIVRDRYGRTSAVGQALIKRIVAQQKLGLTGRQVLLEARSHDHGYSPGGAA